ALAREFTSDSGIRVEIESNGACELPLPVEAELYRIAEQALANVQQHSSAREVRLSIGCTKRSATLTIADDGAGFDPRHVSADRHGIEGMRERARIAGGTLRITSRRGKGTTITVKVPK
ncbi:MAG: sensor histidine kinase, partial [Thermoanaerobaculia bacterium]